VDFFFLVVETSPVGLGFLHVYLYIYIRANIKRTYIVTERVKTTFYALASTVIVALCLRTIQPPRTYTVECITDKVANAGTNSRNVHGGYAECTRARRRHLLRPLGTYLIFVRTVPRARLISDETLARTVIAHCVTYTQRERISYDDVVKCVVIAQACIRSAPIGV